MEDSFQGPRIGYPVVEFARDIIPLYASSAIVGDRDHVDGFLL